MKKIMIALLAIAVLFGFAACDNSNAGGNLDYVVSLSVAETDGEYFANEKLSVSDFAVTATTDSGATFLVPAIDLEFDSGNATTTVGTEVGQNKDIAKIVYVGPYATPSSGKASVMITGSVYTLTDLDVSGTPSITYYTSNVNADIVKADYTVKAQSKTGDTVAYERVLDASDYSVSAAGWTAGPQVLTFKESISASSNETNTKLSINVLPDYITDFTAVIGGDDATAYAVVGGKSASDPTAYMTITYTLASGKMVAEDDLGSLTAASGEWDDTVVTTPGTTVLENKEYTVKLTATGASATDKIEHEVKFTPAAENYIIKFSATDADLTAGSTITGSDLTLAVTWADEDADKPYTTVELQAKVRFDGEREYTVPTGYPASTAIPCAITLDGIDAPYDSTKPLTTKAGA